MDATVIRSLVDLRDRTIQKSRIAFGNRIDAVKNGKDNMKPNELRILEKWYERFEMMEQELDEELRILSKGNEIVERLSDIKGISSILALKLTCKIDIARAENISSLWRYSGYGVVDGEREKPIKGEKLHYNKYVKTTCYLIASSFLKCKSPYSQIYYSSKEFYTINRPDWPKGHCHNAAMRKMIKIFLSHLWVIWRQIEGLPITEPYAMDRLGHNSYLKPEEFGWKEL